MFEHTPLTSKVYETASPIRRRFARFGASDAVGGVSEFGVEGAHLVFEPLEGGVSAQIRLILVRLDAICLNTPA